MLFMPFTPCTWVPCYYNVYSKCKNEHLKLMRHYICSTDTCMYVRLAVYHIDCSCLHSSEEQKQAKGKGNAQVEVNKVMDVLYQLFSVWTKTEFMRHCMHKSDMSHMCQPQGQEEYDSTNQTKEENTAANVRDVVQRRLGREWERGIMQSTLYCTLHSANSAWLKV